MADYKIISPKRAVGAISLPASKSISNRALILNALCGGKSQLRNVAHCDDTDAMERALAQLRRARGGERIEVNIGAAGTAMRFLTAYIASCEGLTVLLDGSERMRQRPISVLVDALRSCGAQIDYAQSEGFPPLLIRGQKLKAAEVEISGEVSSQYISAILMISPRIEGCKAIRLSGQVISLPYIEMTLGLMREFGVEAAMRDAEIVLAPNAAYSRSCDYEVESDWSAASYWFEIASLLPESEILLKGLHEQSLQGDQSVCCYFEPLGVKTEYTADGVVLRGGEPVSDHIEMDLSGNPDLAQTIVVTACVKGVPFVISGLQTLKIKETDRIAALQSQLRKLGYVIEEIEGNSLCWDGTMCPAEQSPEIATFEDHRMAMAFAPAAVKFEGLKILSAGVVSKSYPDYWQHLQSVGFEVKGGEQI